MKLDVVVLAAGKGRRMQSDLPKVLQPLAGRPLLAHVLETVGRLEGARAHVVYGHGGEQVQAAFAGAADLSWHLQAEQLGTGHAVACAMPGIPEDDATVLVLYGDVPLVTADTLERLLALTRGPTPAEPALALLTQHADDPTGYGRIVRDGEGRVTRIVEEKDADAATRAIREVNTGLLAMRADHLRAWLERLDNGNAQGEYYLTDVVAMAVDGGVPVNALVVQDGDEVLGINDRIQLAEAEAALRRRHARTLMRAGVTLADPARLDVRGELACGRDVFIDVNCVFEGRVVLGDRVRIGPGAVLRDTQVAADAVIHAHSLLDGARVGQGCSVGPFARLRPGADLADAARVGNFVEVKKSTIGEGSKVNHLTYVGDAEVGSGVNVGCGTVTCNYDGRRKHTTVIEDGAFIGSGTMLVAPVTVGSGAYIGSGSVITRDAPAGALTLGRARQVTLSQWTPPGTEDEE